DMLDFNPRSQYRERPIITFFHILSYGFQSTLPIQGATMVRDNLIDHQEISIHAPNTGSDLCLTSWLSVSLNFNPRSQYRERQRDIDKINTSILHIVSFILFLPIETKNHFTSHA